MKKSDIRKSLIRCRKNLEELEAIKVEKFSEKYRKYNDKKKLEEKIKDLESKLKGEKENE